MKIIETGPRKIGLVSWAIVRTYRMTLVNVKNRYSFLSHVKNRYSIFTNVMNRYQMLTHVKNWYQIITDVKNWYLLFTDVNDRICDIKSDVKGSIYNMTCGCKRLDYSLSHTQTHARTHARRERERENDTFSKLVYVHSS